jgi:hypothetical protein
LKKFMVTVATAMLAVAVTGVPAQAAAPVEPVIATFDVVGTETFKATFTSESEIKRAYEVLAGEGNPHPNGRIVYGSPGINTGYSWHLTDVVWSDMSMEVCDGLPSDVEKRQITSDYFCPWGAKLVKLEPAR